MTIAVAKPPLLEPSQNDRQDGDEKNLRAGEQVYQWVVGLFLGCRWDPGGPGLVSGLTVDFGALLHRDSACWGRENKSRPREISSLGCVGAAVFALSREITNPVF